MLSKLKEKLAYAKENAHTHIALSVYEVEEIIKEVNALETKSPVSKLSKKDDDMPR